MSRHCPDCGVPVARYPKRTGKCHACAAADRRTGPALIEEIEFLSGETPERIAQRLGKSLAAIARTLYREGRHDLARPFGAASKRKAAA